MSRTTEPIVTTSPQNPTPGTQEDHREQGSLLLDVLIGMAIFALVVIIAVSVISQYRARAYEQGAVSDALAVGLAVEAAITDGNGQPPADVEGVLDRVTLTNGNSVAEYAPASGSFALCVEHESGAFARYNSAESGLVARGRDGGCADGSGDGGAGEASTFAYLSTWHGGLNLSVYDVDGDGYATAPTRGQDALDALSNYLSSRYPGARFSRFGGEDQPTLNASIPGANSAEDLYDDISAWLARSYPDLTPDPNSAAG